MEREIAQIRYFGNTSENNYPQGVNLFQGLRDGSIFASYGPIISLGIQTSLPGVKFCINESNGYTVIGASGIYELDLTGLSMIEELTFSKDFIDAINIYNSQNAGEGAHLMVDIIYEG